MPKSLLPPLVLLVAAALVGPATAQNGPMVPSATPSNGPVMPTAPAQPMPMPGSNNAPMIPQTMPGTSSTSAAPVPMPGATETTPTKPTVLIRVTVIDAPAGFSPMTTGSQTAATSTRDDLHAARAAAARRHVTLTTVGRPSITTLSDVPATLTIGTAVPDTKGQKSGALNIGDTLMTTPHINPDGTVTVKLSFTQTHLAITARQQAGPPQTETQAVSATKTFHSGDTLLLGHLAQPGGVTRLLFAAANVIPAGKANP